jgi:hypothetical protein
MTRITPGPPQHAKLAQLVEQLGPDNRSWQRIAAQIPGCGAPRIKFPAPMACRSARKGLRAPPLPTSIRWQPAPSACPPNRPPLDAARPAPGAARPPAAARRRNGKQCRERWLNHLRTDIKRGGWTTSEELLLCQLRRPRGRGSRAA